MSMGGPWKRAVPLYRKQDAIPIIVVRRFGAREIARKAAGGRERKHLLGQPANLEGKPEGERSMAEKRHGPKGCR